MGHRQFIERLLIAILVIALALLFWQLRHIVVLAFAAVLVSIIFLSLAALLRRVLPVPEKLSLLLSVLMVFALFGFAFWLFGSEVMAQARTIQETLPNALQAVQGYAESYGLGEELQGAVREFGGMQSAASQLGSFAMTLGGGLTDALLVIVGGIYFAVQPELYRIGLIKLAPGHARSLVATALEDSATALRLWLVGQLVSMVVIGVLTGLGLWLLGVPSALALGLLAGLLEFVPYVGPILAALPAILLALTVSPELALWTALLYLLLQQVEGNLLQPIVQQRAVDLPPALLLFMLVAGASLFGWTGILIATPLTVVLFVLVKRLYVREALNTNTPIPGEN